jgi:hypothetical protein
MHAGGNATVAHSEPVAAAMPVIDAPGRNSAVFGFVAKRAPVAMAHDVLRPDGRNASVPHSKPVAANTSVINAPRGNRAVYGTVAKRVAQDRPKMARKEKTKTKRIKTCIFLSFCFCCFLVFFVLYLLFFLFLVGVLFFSCVFP